jgi:hypothetical protein
MLCYYFTTFTTEVQLYCYYKSRLRMQFYVYIHTTYGVFSLRDFYST